MVCLVSLALAAVLPARSDTTGTWMGTVSYINKMHIGVKAQARVRDFVIPSNFTEVYSAGGSKVGLSTVKVGSTVKVTFVQSPMFGSTRVSRIDFAGLSLPLPSQPPL